MARDPRATARDPRATARDPRATARDPRATARDPAVDLFRGLAIALMVLANYLAGVRSVPGWLKHAPDIGLTVVDLVAPFFILAIGLTYSPSLARRLAAGSPAAAVGHFVRRFLAFIGIGAVLSAGERLFGQGAGDWGVLQAIGVAGLLALPTLLLPAHWRAAAGLALLAGYQLALQRWWLPTVLGSSHGGILGSVGWTAMLVLATTLGDQRDERGGELRFLTGSAGALAAGLALALLAPVSKNRVSASYVLVSLGAGGLLFAGFSFAVRRLGLRISALSWWGENPLLLYLLHGLLLAVVVLPGADWWYAGASPLLVAAQAAGLLAALTALAGIANRRGFRFTL